MKKNIMHKDILPHSIAALAIFGLVVSSAMATLGVATLGVQAQVAFAQFEANSAQTASVEFAAKHLEPTLIPKTASTTHPIPTDDMGMSSTTHPILAASGTPAIYCPKISKVVSRGGKDATTTGDVSELQRFMANHFGLKEDEVVSGYFGSTTESLVKKFQMEQGIEPASTVGPLTRALIAKMCSGGDKDEHRSGTSTVMMNKEMRHSSSTEPMGDMRRGSTTMPMATGTLPTRPHLETEFATTTRQLPPPHRERFPTTTATPGVSIENYEGSSNAAAVISAVAQIGEGYGKLFSAMLSLTGL